MHCDQLFRIKTGQGVPNSEGMEYSIPFFGSFLKLFLLKVNGQFGDWKQWGACSVTCGTGTQTRIRYCNSPSPSNGGSDCQGPREDTRPCLQGNCPGADLIPSLNFSSKQDGLKYVLKNIVRSAWEME